eukprot:scaffold4702_cov79-Isochrysis_galbana.AAC.1
MGGMEAGLGTVAPGHQAFWTLGSSTSPAPCQWLPPAILLRPVTARAPAPLPSAPAPTAAIKSTTAAPTTPYAARRSSGRPTPTAGRRDRPAAILALGWLPADQPAPHTTGTGPTLTCRGVRVVLPAFCSGGPGGPRLHGGSVLAQAPCKTQPAASPLLDR